MNERLPALKAKDLVQALTKAGFVIVRTKGSHQILAHSLDPKLFTIVPMHVGKDIPRPLIHKIIKQAGFTVPSFRNYL